MIRDNTACAHTGAAPSLVTLKELLAIGRPPDHPVAWRGDRCVRWSEFAGQVHALSGFIDAQIGANWLVACADPYEFAVALFAVWHAGGRVLVPPSLQPGALDALAAHADGVIDHRVLRAATSRPPSGPMPLRMLDPLHAGLDLYTSGTTGKARRISKSLRQLDAEVATLAQLWGDAGGPMLATVPHHHIYGLLFRLLWPLAAGRPFDVETCTLPETLLGRLGQLGPAVLVSSPAQLARLPDLLPLEVLAGRCTCVFSSGGPLPAPTAQRFLSTLGAAPVEVYGSTETGGIAWRRQDGDDAWTPLPGVTVDFDGDRVLHVQSPFLPDDAPFVTGDAGRALSDGRFRLAGRVDRIVKIEGKRLSLADMEARLVAHPWVSEAALVVLSGRRQTVAAALVASAEGVDALARDGRGVVARALRRHLAHWFDPVLLPRRWRYPAALPHDERGKLPTAVLAALFGDNGAVDD